MSGIVSGQMVLVREGIARNSLLNASSDDSEKLPGSGLSP